MNEKLLSYREELQFNSSGIQVLQSFVPLEYPGKHQLESNDLAGNSFLPFYCFHFCNNTFRIGAIEKKSISNA